MKKAKDIVEKKMDEITMSIFSIFQLSMVECLIPELEEKSKTAQVEINKEIRKAEPSVRKVSLLHGKIEAYREIIKDVSEIYLLDELKKELKAEAQKVIDSEPDVPF